MLLIVAFVKRLGLILIMGLQDGLLSWQPGHCSLPSACYSGRALVALPRVRKAQAMTLLPGIAMRADKPCMHATRHCKPACCRCVPATVQRAVCRLLPMHRFAQKASLLPRIARCLHVRPGNLLSQVAMHMLHTDCARRWAGS